MEAFVNLQAIAVPINQRNLDTNQLCPTRFNKLPVDDPDYPKVLFNNERFYDDGREREAFILNRDPYRKAKIIVADENFGCGSSRESAVYALLSYGIRSVIAPSFGDIFSANAAKNGLLTVVLDVSSCDQLRAQLTAKPGMSLEVDLPSQQVIGADLAYPFDVHPVVKRCLLEGLDDVGRTLRFRALIEQFEERHRADLPWVFKRRDPQIG